MPTATRKNTDRKNSRCQQNYLQVHQTGQGGEADFLKGANSIGAKIELSSDWYSSREISKTSLCYKFSKIRSSHLRYQPYKVKKWGPSLITDFWSCHFLNSIQLIAFGTKSFKSCFRFHHSAKKHSNLGV